MDEEQAGRLRLIAVYTGDKTNRKILDKIFNEIPETIRNDHDYNKTASEITSDSGVRIVVLFKDHGIRLPEPRRNFQVNETDLPKRLQAEFSKLSEGLLSNVALTAVGSLRRSTHHVLASSKAAGRPVFSPSCNDHDPRGSRGICNRYRFE